MGRNVGDFQEAHNWSKGQDDDGFPVETSTTSVGKYTVNKGRGKLKWAVNHDSGWEALGTTRNEVRAEANLDLANRLKNKDN